MADPRATGALRCGRRAGRSSRTGGTWKGAGNWLGPGRSGLVVSARRAGGPGVAGLRDQPPQLSPESIPVSGPDPCDVFALAKHDRPEVFGGVRALWADRFDNGRIAGLAPLCRRHLRPIHPLSDLEVDL